MRFIRLRREGLGYRALEGLAVDGDDLDASHLVLLGLGEQLPQVVRKLVEQVGRLHVVRVAGVGPELGHRNHPIVVADIENPTCDAPLAAMAGGQGAP